MAAKISRARLHKDNTAFVHARDYSRETHGLALCPDLRCLCKLRGVPRTERTVKDERIAVDAYFGLPAGAERKGQGHTARCRYNVEDTVRRLVAVSERIDSFGRSSPKILHSPRGRRAEYRLHILMELLNGRLPAGERGGAEVAGHRGRRAGTQFIRGRERLAPYFRMAQAVLTLMARVQEMPELAQWIVLKYGRNEIAWSEYFYELHDSGRLYDYLVAHSQVSGGAVRELPVAAVVAIDQKQPIRATKHGNWSIQCRRFRSDSAVHGEIAVKPVLYVKGEKLAAMIRGWDLALVCALPTAKPLLGAPTPELRPETEINFSIVNRFQVCQYVLQGQ